MVLLQSGALEKSDDSFRVCPGICSAEICLLRETQDITWRLTHATPTDPQYVCVTFCAYYTRLPLQACLLSALSPSVSPFRSLSLSLSISLSLLNDKTYNARGCTGKIHRPHVLSLVSLFQRSIHGNSRIGRHHIDLPRPVLQNHTSLPSPPRKNAFHQTGLYPGPVDHLLEFFSQCRPELAQASLGLTPLRATLGWLTGALILGASAVG